MGLKVWDSNSDEFSPSDLEFNWDAIDTDYSRARPTDRAEILSAVPGSGNFAGRLVYLSTASGGVPAHTLIRFDGSAWRTVGPHEVHAAVPSTGNYAGRVVLLSASDSGFAAWTLITYDGSTWTELGRQITVSATVPGTGNYNGRVVVLSASDGGFNAWDMIVYNGTSYVLVGPSREPPIASTLAALTTANGRKGAIVGSTDLTNLTYTTSLSSKWKSDAFIVGVQQDQAQTTSDSYVSVPASNFPTPWIPWGDFQASSLKPEFKLIVEMASSNASGTASCAMALRVLNADAIPGALGAEFGEVTLVGVDNTLKASSWVSTTPSAAGYLNIGLRFKSSSTSYTTTIQHATILLRWSS